MLKKLSYKSKLKAALIGAGIMLIICYRFSISKTIDEYRLYKQNSAFAVTGDETYSLENLKLKNRMLEEALDKFILDTMDNSKNLLGAVTSLCNQNDLSLKEYKPSPVALADSLKLLTRSITVQGKFVDCLKLLYALETRSKIGRVSSVLFKSYTNPGNSETNLNCTIYVQNIIP